MTVQLSLPEFPGYPRFVEREVVRKPNSVPVAASTGALDREVTTSTVRLPSAFSELFIPSRYKAYYGGRGSAKSHSFATALLVKLSRRPMRWLCCREVQVSIRDSVKRLLDDKISDLGFQHLFTSTDAEIRGVNGSLIIFAGLRTDPYKIKSIEGLDGAWVEEANTVSRRSLELLIPTVRGIEVESGAGRETWKPKDTSITEEYRDAKPGSPEWQKLIELVNSDDFVEGDPEIWFTWNPQQPTDPVDEMFRGKNTPPNSIIREINWQDNPWFPRVLREELEHDRRVDPEKYAHIWNGAYWTRSNARVFNNWRVGVDYEFNPQAGTVFRFGADWGFAIDPTTIHRSWIEEDRPTGWERDRLRRRLFVDWEEWEVGLEIDDTPALFNSVPGASEWPIVADSARPETISYMRSHGFPKMEPARKGPGSVDEGVKFLQGIDEIVVHPRCPHLIDELRLYSYKVDPLTGRVLPILEDKKNHCIDDLRYAYEGHRTVGGFVVW